MLSELTIENIAVIERATVSFTRGFQCLTGETGAGKSIIIDAINCITGEKTSRELIRSGESSARVTAVFSDLSESVLSFLAENDVESEENTLILSRRISRDGKNSCRVNGYPVPLSLLRALGERLVNIHGQMDSKNLLDADRHFVYIDAFGNLSDLLAAYQADYRRLCDIRSEMKRLTMDESEKLKEIDRLDFQIEELTAAELKIGEREELAKRRDVARNAKKIVDALAEVSLLLSGDEYADGASQKVSAAVQALQNAADYLPELGETAGALQETSYTLSDIGADIKNRLSDVSYSESEADAIESRLDELQRLSRKYGATEEDMLRYLEEAKKRRAEIDLSEERLAELSGLFDEAAEQAKKSAKALSRARKTAAADFAARVEEQLRFLDMPDVRFTVSDTITPLGENGVDKMAFLFSANKGEAPKALARIASGGELSRVMLAIKNVLSVCDTVGTLIFDEIDTGVSGRAAEKVAMKLVDLSRSRQVVCVTHLTQLAMFADTHFLIQKTSDDARTTTSVTCLDEAGRAYELARMGSGTNIGETQLQNARQLLAYAENYKKNL